MNPPSLHHMIGQLFIIGFKGDNITEKHPIYRDIKDLDLGGVILFDRHLATKSANNNITGQSQLRELTAKLQNISSTKLFIAVDQEGGKVNRFRDEFGFELTSSAAELGRVPDTELTQKSAIQVAEMLKSCGVNFNLAPVVDLNSNINNPIIGKVERSFSNNSATVYHHASTWIAEHRKVGIGSCLKHFPGHGSSKNDSHLGFVEVTESWHETELEPYVSLIKSGQAQSIMVGHLYNKALDSEFPATLSEPTITGLLRGKMNYQGVVITDDMQMKAITDRYGLVEACIKAISAGVDLIIIGNNLNYDPEIFATLHNEVARAVENGTLKEKTIREAWTRVQRLKTNIT